MSFYDYVEGGFPSFGGKVARVAPLKSPQGPQDPDYLQTPVGLQGQQASKGAESDRNWGFYIAVLIAVLIVVVAFICSCASRSKDSFSGRLKPSSSSWTEPKGVNPYTVPRSWEAIKAKWENEEMERGVFVYSVAGTNSPARVSVDYDHVAWVSALAPNAYGGSMTFEDAKVLCQRACHAFYTSDNTHNLCNCSSQMPIGFPLP